MYWKNKTYYAEEHIKILKSSLIKSQEMFEIDKMKIAIVTPSQKLKSGIIIRYKFATKTHINV